MPILIRSEFNVGGAAAITRALKRIAPKIRKRVLRRALKKGGDVFKAASESNAPRKSGKTVGSFKISSRVLRSDPKTMSVMVGPGRKAFIGESAFYPRLVEFGTSKMSAKPWMRPAFERSKNAAALAISAEFRRAFARAVR